VEHLHVVGPLHWRVIQELVQKRVVFEIQTIRETSPSINLGLEMPVWEGTAQTVAGALETAASESGGRIERLVDP
jgi:hypothetical protein